MRNVSIGLVCVLVFLAPGTVTAQSDPSLRARWSFTERQGLIAGDTSENGHDGQITGALWSICGLSGSALSFDGVGDRVDCATPVLNRPPYTVCAWALPVSISENENRYIIANGGETSYSYGFNLILRNHAGQHGWYFGVIDSTGNWGEAEIPATELGWTFICGTWDGTSEPNSVRLYVNGLLAAEGTPSLHDAGPASNLRIGSPTRTTEVYGWDGQLDELRVYDRVLPDEEILLLMQQTRPLPMASWCFDEGQGTIAHDGTGQGADGEVIGATWTNSGTMQGGLSFDGEDDRVEFSSPVWNRPPYSVSAWVQANSISDPSNRYIIANGGETSYRHGLALLLRNVGHMWFFSVIDSTGLTGEVQTPALSTGWTHLCGSWDGTADSSSIKLYVDGVLTATARPTQQTAGSAGNLRIGSPSGPTTEYHWAGSIDEVRIFRRVLTPDEVACLHAEIPTSGVESRMPQGETVRLLGSRPNPFNPVTNLSFDTGPGVHDARIVLYDVGGKEVRRVELGSFGPGVRSVPWDGTKNDGSLLPSGVYYYTLRHAGGGTDRERCILVR